MEQIADRRITEEILEGLCRLISNDSAEFGVEGGHGAILSRAREFTPISDSSCEILFPDWL
jgi:hypothetical protein